MDLYKRMLKINSEDIFTGDEQQTFISTGVLTLNLLLSGKIDGGIPMNKVSLISAPSALGKSLIGLSILKNAQKVHDYCVVLDSEKSFDFDLAKKFGIDTDKTKLLVIRQKRIEEIEHQIVNLTNEFTKEERKKIFFLLDSWGALITSKVIKDATEGKDVVDMTEAKKKNRLANVIANTDSTFFIINHVYDSLSMYGEKYEIPGGRRIIYISDCSLLGTSKAKEKDEQEINGYIIICKCHKSRFAKENSKLKFRIKIDGGLDVFYGLLDDAIESGCVYKPVNGSYSRKHIENDNKFKEQEIYTSDFWLPIFKDTNFKQYLEEKYSYRSSDIQVKEDIVL